MKTAPNNSPALPVYYINARSEAAVPRLGHQLELLLQTYSRETPPVVLCIGTDRVTGDSLGPLVGTFLLAAGCHRYLPVYGTLEAPVHALNLPHTWRQIKKKHPRSPVLAVDASLGIRKHLDYITLGHGSLKPGAGVQKQLLSVGDLFITGIVCTNGLHAQAALENTRLSRVTRIAGCISQGILYACCPALLAAACQADTPSL